MQSTARLTDEDKTMEPPKACGDDSTLPGYFYELTKKAISAGRAEEVMQAFHERAVASHTQQYGPFGNLFFRPMMFDGKGSFVKGHSHNFDHATFISRGSLHVRAFKIKPDNTPEDSPAWERDYKSPAAVLIKANVSHEFTALEDGTVATCIFALRDFKGEVTDTWDGNMVPYC
jgi:hypothetical protein